LESLSSSPLLAGERVQVRAGGYETDIAAGDLAALVMGQAREKTDEAAAGLTLRQRSLQALFACGIEIDGTITVKKPEALSDEVFRIFAHACLVRIPRVEIAVEDQLRRVLWALGSNDDFSRFERLEQMRDAVTILAQDLRRVRSGLYLSRQRGRADGRYFPPDVRCRRWFHRPRRVKEYALPGCALTNSFPSSRYVCSWDLRDGLVTNLVIPSEGVNSLMGDLKKGKFLGFKLSYLYSGKAMLVWDGVAFVVSALVLALCEVMKGSTTASDGVKGFCSVLAYLLGALAVTLFGKLLFHDLGHWAPWHRQVTKFFLHKFDGEKEPPEDDS
jgi:hypothetical protein